jgi:hypothetical protein
VKQVTAIDNPLNGYVDGHSDSEDLGIFVLSPRTINLKNHPPEQGGLFFWVVTNNIFNPDQTEFYDPSK